MMQPAGGMVQPPMGNQQLHAQQWPMMPPPPPPPQAQYYQAQPPAAMWNNQPSQVPPPPQYQASPPVPMMAPQVAQQLASADEIRTLWIGDLQYWMDESYLYGCFAHTGEVVSVKVIRNKQTGQPESYGFIEFINHAAAERALQTYNGQMMPNIEQSFRLNWATCGAGERRGDSGADYTIFVGDLAADVTDYLLQETFKNRYPSVKGAKIVTDKLTGRSKGYGFVRFGDPNEQASALTEMNGVYCSTRPMRVGPAANKKNSTSQQYSADGSYQNQQGNESDNDPNNTTIFVGGLDPSVTDDLLRQAFSPCGELIHVKIPVGKRCGFVQFANRASAEDALRLMNGTLLGGQNIRLSWGRSPTNKQPQQQDPMQWNGNYYGYENYGYAPPSQDPNMYGYATYPGYSNYQQPPQQPQ